MDLKEEINFYDLARDETDLSNIDAAFFELGLKGNSKEHIHLAREPYTQLQRAFEQAMVDVMRRFPNVGLSEPEDQELPPFIYRTPKLATPIHNPDHPRRDIVYEMIRQRRAALICNYEGLDGIMELEHMQDDARAATNRDDLGRILANHHKAFSHNPQNAGTDHTFMVTRPFGGLSPVQFTATQMPELKNDSFGTVRFGDKVVLEYMRALQRHSWNLSKNRTGRSIRRILGLN